jgi:ferredoxin
MAYVVTDACIACRYTDCVVVCPTDCFHVGPNMMVIAPDECIDCGVCVPECPVDAITHESSAQGRPWIAFNQQQASRWPLQTARLDSLPGAEERAREQGKYPRLLIL